MRIVGHRGASRDQPENTLEAFAEAVAQGADGIELDVMACGSGELVVCHDESLARLAGVDLDVRLTPLTRLKRLDVGSRLGFAPARIPTLAEVFEMLPGDFFVNIEMKCITRDDRGLARAVGRFIEKHALGSRVLVSSFNALCLVRLAQEFPQVPRGYLSDPQLPWVLEEFLWANLCAKDSIHPFDADCTEARVKRWKARGWQVAVWTVDDVARARTLRDFGVDMLITNVPGAMRAGLSA